MGTKRSDEFRADAVRIALTSGLMHKQVASDLGVGLSTLNKWVTAHRDTDVVSDKELDLERLAFNRFTTSPLPKVGASWVSTYVSNVTRFMVPSMTQGASRRS